MTTTLKNFVIGTLIFSFIMVSGLFMINDVNTNYNVTTDTSDFNDTYDQIDETFSLSEDIKNATLYGDVEGTDQSWESLVKNSYKSIKFVSAGFKLVGRIISQIALTLGVPQFVVTFAMTGISVVIMFAIVAVVFRFKG